MFTHVLSFKNEAKIELHGKNKSTITDFYTSQYNVEKSVKI